MSLLQIDHLNVTFRTPHGAFAAVRDISLSLDPGETLCVVGESGSGKSTVLNALMGIIARNGIVEAESLLFEGRQLRGLPERELERIRGDRIGMIFQNPQGALNPVRRIGSLIAETLRKHRGLTGPEARREAVRLLEWVGLPEPEKRLDQYAHELSGGMSQRVVIALALACRPALLLADEPTTALDVTVQAQILDLLDRLKTETGMALLLVTHDLGVVAEIADKVLVMRHGAAEEFGPVAQVLRAPRSAYTRELLSLMPSLEDGSPAAPVRLEAVS